MKDKKRQRKYFSYKKMRETFENSDDKIEKRVLEKILSDYEHNHKNELFDFEKMLKEGHQNVCPNCGSIHVVKDGKNRNGTARLKCSDCKKRFNPTSHSFFYSTKVNMDAWLTFVEGIVSETSIKSACTSAKISIVTGTSWMKKIFKVLENYQDSIVLEGDIYIDETYVHEDSSKIYYKEEIDEETKIRKQPRGISRNKIGILLATNSKQSFAKIIGHGRPARLKNYEICLQHIKPGSSIIGDEDKSLTYAAKKLDLNRTTFKANTQEAYDNLKPIDELCKYFKFFIDKHRGFKKEALQDYINLFIFLHNEKINDAAPYKIAEKLLKMLFTFQKTDEKD